MKLRIKGNSIRLRVLRPEVERLAQGRRVEEILRLGLEPEDCLTYAAQASASVRGMRVEHTASCILVFVPADQVERWAVSDQVGIYGTIVLGDDQSLDVAIEKDFACLDLTDAENTGTFINPKADRLC